MQIRIVIILGLILLGTSSAMAQFEQKTSFREGISVTPMYGITAFHGDVGPDNNQGQAIGIVIDKEFFEKIGIKLRLDNGNTQGIYVENGYRIFEGTADYFQFGVGSYFNLSNIFGGYERYRKIFISAGLGVGLINFDEWNRYLEGSDKLVYDGGTVTGELMEQTPFTENLHYIDEHGKSNAPYFDTGIMLDYKLSQNWYIKFDATLNYLFTSRMDGIEHEYYSSDLGIYYDSSSDTFAQGDNPAPRSNDYFYTFKVGIRYRMSYKKRDNNTGTALPSNRHKWKRLPSNQFFENIIVPGTNAPKTIQ